MSPLTLTGNAASSSFAPQFLEKRNWLLSSDARAWVPPKPRDHSSSLQLSYQQEGLVLLQFKKLSGKLTSRIWGQAVCRDHWPEANIRNALLRAGPLSCMMCCFLLWRWTWVLVYINRSWRTETPKCHAIICWNLKPISMSFHNVAFNNSSTWLPHCLILCLRRQ